jgi:type II secretory pathway pseudopilin PulG
MKKIKKLKIKKEGFTLIEMMVAMVIFITLIGVITGLFITGIRQQKNIMAFQNVLDQTSYVVEYMSRNLRLAKKEISAGSCLSQTGLNFEVTRGGSALKFINHLQGDDCQEFFLENNQIQYWRQSTNNSLPLTSNKLEVVSLKFNLTGESQADDLQPLVTVFLEIKSESSPGQSQKIKIQASVSQRNLDVEF